MIWWMPLFQSLDTKEARKIVYYYYIEYYIKKEANEVSTT